MRKRAAASSRAQISSQKRLRRKKTADGAPPPGLSSCCATHQIQATLKRQRKRKTPDDDALCPIADAQVILSSPHSSQKRPRRKKTAADGAPPPGLSSCCATHQIQAAPLKRRQRKRKTPDDDVLCPISDDAQEVILSSSPSWGCGAKRSRRSAVSKKERDWAYLDDGPVGLICPISDDAQEVILSSPSWGWGAKRSAVSKRERDWAYLHDGPVGLIAERVLANDVADYIRFRAVCLHWRRWSADTRGRGVLDDRRFHPRNWIMLVGDRKKRKAADRHQFLNTSTGQCIQVAIPELRDHRVLPCTAAAEGLLFLLCRATAAVRLLNPLTRHMAELPPITGMGPLVETDTAGLADDRTVLLYFSCHGGTRTLAFAKPGDESWMLVKSDPHPRLISTVSCAGRFYGTTVDAVMTVDMREEGLPPRLVVAAKMDKRMRLGTMTGGSVHLVDNGEELVLVHRTIRSICGGAAHKWMYKVYRIDLDRGTMLPTPDLRGRAVFIDDEKTLSVVAPQVSPFIHADTVYSDTGVSSRPENYIGAYHLRDGSYEVFLNNEASIRPWSIADCLAAYVRTS